MIENLERMIAHPFRHPITNGRLVLSEIDQVDFSLDLGVRAFPIRIDLPARAGADATFPFLKEDFAGLTAKCDLIVFVPHDNRNFVFLIELKSLQNGSYFRQLRGAREFTRYLVALMKLHGISSGEPEFYGVLIKSRRVPAKSTTRQRDLIFEMREDLLVCECDRSRPLSLSDLVRAVAEDT